MYMTRVGDYSPITLVCKYQTCDTCLTLANSQNVNLVTEITGLRKARQKKK